jgi:hypothetical protein
MISNAQIYPRHFHRLFLQLQVSYERRDNVLARGIGSAMCFHSDLQIVPFNQDFLHNPVTLKILGKFNLKINANATAEINVKLHR